MKYNPKIMLICCGYFTQCNVIFRPRYSTFASILRLRDAAMRGLHDILGQMDYICVNTPILTANDCEGAGEVFSVMPHNKTLLSQMKKNKEPDEEGYFGCNAFLTVSGQLQLEAAVRFVYYFIFLNRLYNCFYF